MLLLYLQLGTIHFIISLEMEQTNSLFLLLTAFIMVLYGQSITYTRFIQKVPGLSGYLKKLTSFHPDISYGHFSSQFDLIYAFLYHFTTMLLFFNTGNEPKV